MRNREAKQQLPSHVEYINCLAWNTKYSQNVTCICKDALSVHRVLLEGPVTIGLFQKNRYDFTACNSVRDILYNTDVIISIVKLFVYSPVGRLV